ncbi:MAG TPA: MFS transporter [Gammaproteobacteria bacterium]
MSRRWAAVAVVYGAGLLQGAAFVLVPALGAVLEAPPYGLSSGAYGALFLPQMVGAILSGLLAGNLRRRWGARGSFRLGLGCNVLAAALLAASVLFAGRDTAYALLLLETALLGLGFGLTLAVINDLATQLFPRATVAAVTVLNAVIGGATAFSPLVLRGLASVDLWWAWPVTLSVLFLGAALASMVLSGETQTTADESGWRWRPLLPFAAAVLLYAAVEGTFGSWAALYLGLHGGSVGEGAFALTAFWSAMTVLRLGLSAVRGHTRIFYLASPVAMAACLTAIALAAAPHMLVALFAAAGAACGIFYPFSMSFAFATFPRSATRVAGLLVAALMVGEGLGSYLPGFLQHWLPMDAVFGVSVLWCLPLFVLALLITGKKRVVSG